MAQTPSRAEILERAQDFLRTHGKPPSMGTLRRWTDYRVPRRVLREVLAELQAARTGEPSQTPRLFTDLPPPRGEPLSTWPQIPAPALVFSDLHVPFQHNEWLRGIVSQALSKGIRRAVIVGDLLDFSHLSIFGGVSGWDAEDELEDLSQVLRWLAQFMAEIHILPGNHDDRFAKKLDRQLSTRWLLRNAASGLAQVQVHEHHHAYLGSTWLVAHPRTYSRSPAQPALKLSEMYGRNVAVGHTHHWNVSRHYGRWAVEIGMVGDPERIRYKQVELTTHPSSELGALLVLEDERPVFLHPAIG